MKNNICAGIITYNPDIATLKNTIEAIRHQVIKIYICDNGSNNVNQIKKLLHESEEIIFLDKNLGIATALNRVFNRAKKEGFDWVLTLDQDSESPNNLIDELEKLISNEVAIISPKISYRNNERFENGIIEEVKEKEWVITSASLTSVAAWEQIDGFDDILFIDKVDYDFCIRARRAGYKIIQNNRVTLLHELGNLEIRQVFNRKVYVTNHSPFRYYYMIRNGFYLKNKLNIGHPYKDLFSKIFKVVVFEDKKWSKVKNMILGTLEFIKLS
ncbi:glycosyltransferase family 2 protein [Streptococcus sp. A22]|uniref:glycosyltransferase family 2 protein n=1 Tax=Streptococcus sp. A22 TaxID=3373126 RepID=UPI00374DCD9D